LLGEKLEIRGQISAVSDTGAALLFPGPKGRLEVSRGREPPVKVRVTQSPGGATEIWGWTSPSCPHRSDTDLKPQAPGLKPYDAISVARQASARESRPLSSAMRRGWLGSRMNAIWSVIRSQTLLA